MDWQKCMNQAIDYIENNLSDEIDYSVAAQCMNCSVWEFQRVFSFMAQDGGSYVVFTIPDEYKKDVGNFMGRCITEYLPATGYELTGVDAEYFTETKWEAWFLVK